MAGSIIQLVVQFIMAAGLVQPEPKHVIFAFVDHFEPFGPLELVNSQTAYWVDDYIAMAKKHTDADGRHPIHSYFVISPPALQHDQLDIVLNKLNQVTYTGYGEIEFHCHHGHPNEAYYTEEESTKELLYYIALAKQQFNTYGALLTAEVQPKIVFGFIHGMWALDNSRLSWWDDPPHYEWCGVNREMDLLKKEGAYADFTFPMSGPMTPRFPDLIYYAADDNSPASYQNISNVFPVGVNSPPQDKLMIIQGPDSRTNVGVKTGVYYDPPNLWRMDWWVNHNVHVAGNDDWIFVKVYTHGLAADPADEDTWDSFFGFTADNFYRSIEQKYNDGINWKLHYVSAREMYNIIKAAEAGKTGDPNDYRDFVIPPYANMVILTNNQYKLVNYDPNIIKLEILENPSVVDISFKHFSPEDGILESNDVEEQWQLSDAEVNLGQFGELHLIDNTPSKYYCIVSLSLIITH